MEPNNDRSYRNHIWEAVRAAFPTCMTRVDCYGYLTGNWDLVLEVKAEVIPVPDRKKTSKPTIRYRKKFTNPPQDKKELADRIIVALKLMDAGENSDDA